MGKIFLVRHGQKTSAVGDPGLSELGRKQASEVGVWLKQYEVGRVVSSPMTRAKETAEIIAEKLGLVIEEDERLVERMNLEEGVEWEEFIGEWVRATNEREYRPKWGRSSVQTGLDVARVIAGIDDNEMLVVVSHGGAIVDYLRSEFGDGEVSVLENWYPMGRDYRFVNCGICEIEVGERRKINKLQVVDHLSEISE